MAIQTVDAVEARKRLQLFNEKTRELQSYSFSGKAFHQDAGVTVDFDFEKKTIEANRVGADNEARAAMCLVFRFFLQPRDRIELHQIAELYQNLPVKDEDKHWVSENLKVLDSFLDRPIELALNGKSISHRAVLETFLYGDQAHANDDKRTVFEAWRENTAIHILLENFFEYAVGHTLRFVLWLAAMNVDAIKALEGTMHASVD